MEEDIVAASVLNAYRQGCEHVYLVDNDSPDGTVAAAVAAGATLAIRYPTRAFNDVLRVSLMNLIVHNVSESLDEEHIWWLWLDADEFSHGPAGMTIYEYLTALDIRFRVVGARYFNHYPTAGLEYVPGFHPIEFQPLCEEYREEHCSTGHRKHPLLRVDRHGAKISAKDGFHKAISDAPLLEPDRALLLHHFPYRQEAVTRARLDQLSTATEQHEPRTSFRGEARNNPSTNAVLRRRSLDAIYDERWADVLEWRGPMLSKINPRPWSSLVSPADATIARWYDVDQIPLARPKRV